MPRGYRRRYSVPECTERRIGWERERKQMQWYKRLTQKVYHGAAFEHRIQASVGLSIVLCAVVIPISIMRIKQLKNREAPVLPDGKGQKIANLISSKLTSRNIENIDKLQLQALKRK